MNKVTLKLLEDILLQVEEFVADVVVDENQNPRQPFQIDATQFDFKHLISCRLCHVCCVSSTIYLFIFSSYLFARFQLTIGPSKDEYLAHITSKQHNIVYAKHINENGFSRTPITDEPIPVLLHLNNNSQKAPEKRIQDVRPQHIDNDKRSRECSRHEANMMKSDEQAKHRYEHNEQLAHNYRNVSGNRPRDRSNNRDGDELNRRNNFDNGLKKRWNSNQSLNNHNYKYNNQSNEQWRNASNELPRPASTVPSVFDDGIYSFIDQQNPKEPNSKSEKIAPTADSDQRRKSLPAANKSSSSTNELPPYMMNSLFLSRLGQNKDEKKIAPRLSAQSNKSKPSQAAKPHQPVRYNENKHKSLPSSRRTSESGDIKPVPSYQLDHLLQKKKEEQYVAKLNDGNGAKAVVTANNAQINSDKIIDILAKLQKNKDVSTSEATAPVAPNNPLNLAEGSAASSVGNEMAPTNKTVSSIGSKGAIPKRSKSYENLNRDAENINAGRRTPIQRLSASTQSNIERMCIFSF